MLIKFCGMRRVEDLEMAASLGVNLCGFIFHQASPRYIDPHIVKNLPTFGMARTGVFVNQNKEEILQISKLANLDYIQLHGNQDQECAKALGKDRIIRVIWPERYENINELNTILQKLSSSCFCFLLDAGKNLGGSGHAITATALYGLDSPLPWFLAGGLSLQNVIECINNFSPNGIDVNSGIENAPGRKDHVKMRDLIHKVKEYSGVK